jgi:very-short-patch-repair endonuclease
VGNTEGTPEPGDSVETKRGASASKEQLQQDYDAAGSLRKLGALYGIGYQKARQMLADAGIEINKRGSNGASKSPAWHEANRRQWTGEGAERRRQALDRGRATRWADPEQRRKASERLQDTWDNDPEWRARHNETLRRMWDDPEQPLKRQWDDPAQRERQRQAWLQRVSAARSKGSDALPGEVALHDALIRASVSFTANAIMLDARYIVDVLVHQRPLIIEADGVSHRIGGNADRDAERAADLEAAGFTIARFTYKQLGDDPDGCMASLGLHSEDHPQFDIQTRGKAFNELGLRRRWQGR